MFTLPSYTWFLFWLWNVDFYDLNLLVVDCNQMKTQPYSPLPLQARQWTTVASLYHNVGLVLSSETFITFYNF